RTEARLSQAELAKRLGTTQSAIARLEGGGVSPSLSTLRRYAEATGTKLQVSHVAQCNETSRARENLTFGRTAKVLTLPAIPSMDRNQVPADLYRAASILRQAGLNLRAYYGASDRGDPLVSFCDPETG